MKTHSSKRWTILMMILTLLFVSSACQSVQPSAPATTTPQPSAAVTATPQPSAAATATPQPDNQTFEANIVFGSGPFNLPETVAGLLDLSGYKATLTLAFDGTVAGQSKKWSKTYVMLAAKKPAARQLTIAKTGDLSDPSPVFMAEVDAAAYERRGENSCIANVIVAGNSLAKRFEPAGSLTGVIGADAAGSETVNGAAANHYKFDERALGLASLAKSQGELWVASNGGYLVKYLLTTKSGADYFGEGTEGTLTWDYELTNVNQPVSIKLPENCPAGMVNAPLLPGAANVESLPGLLTFDTSTSLADAAAFYQKQMPTLGWQLDGEPAIGDTAVLMDFTQGDQTLSVFISTDNGETSVDISLAR